MKETSIIWIVFISITFQLANTTKARFYNYDDYLDNDPEWKDSVSLNSLQRPNKLLFNGLTRSDIMKLAESSQPSIETTECTTGPPLTPLPPQESDITNGAEPTTTESNPKEEVFNKEDNKDDKTGQLRNLVQLLYVAQARVQLEASEIKKAQAVANSAQQSLEEAANHVRTITANLQNSQQEVASAAIRAQTAQLQLAAHDQLLFAARQDVDALSTQLVGLQAAEGVTQPKTTVDLADLLEKLKQPLQEAQKPTPVPSVIKISTSSANHLQNHKLQHNNAPAYQRFYHK